MRHHLLICALVVLESACDEYRHPMVPDVEAIEIAVAAGNEQFAGTGSELAKPLSVIVQDARTRDPIPGMRVRWTVVEAPGAAELTPVADGITDRQGYARATLKVGEQLGDYVVEATFEGNTGSAARLRARASATPVVESIEPQDAAAGETVVLHGRNFSELRADNVVMFGSMRAEVSSASSTEIRVIVPRCIPTREVAVSTSLGVLSSPAVRLLVRGARLPIALGAGEINFIADPRNACATLPDIDADAEYVLIAQNISSQQTEGAAFQIDGMTGSSAAIPLPLLATTALPSPASELHARLRAREQMLFRQPRAAREVAAFPRLVPGGEARVGSHGFFDVLNGAGGTTPVDAQLKAISKHALVYQDVKAPAGGFGDDDFAAFARAFDDPIYATDTSIYGNPSDIDGNGRVIILLSPVVNEMSKPEDDGYVAGFFNPCDLAQEQEAAEFSWCIGRNAAEIFYAIVPDPEGLHGRAHSREHTLRTVEPVLAHEFQHMITFNQRFFRQKAAASDSLWLAEALAHSAESAVAAVYQSRGDVERAKQYRENNYIRAAWYAIDPTKAGILSFAQDGIEQRGAAWLFLEYLRERFGDDLLRRLTQTTDGGVSSIEAQTGVKWSELVSDWSIALYADDAPELRGSTIPARFTFPQLNIREALSEGTRDGRFPLEPAELLLGDFSAKSNVPASSAQFVLIRGNAQRLSLSLSVLVKPTSGRVTSQLAILRLS
jgi:hypothetical protein